MCNINLKIRIANFLFDAPTLPLSPTPAEILSYFTKMRQHCTETIAKLPENSPATKYVREIRKACRAYLDKTPKANAEVNQNALAKYMLTTGDCVAKLALLASVATKI